MAGVYTVKQINSYIKNMFKQDFLLSSVSVKGEVSNCKYHTSGHIYFTLKDADATISVIMFASQASKLNFTLKDGMSVVCEGRIDVYDAAGKYQLYAFAITKEGIGDLYKKFEELKAMYEEMGYFASEYKRPIPKFTKRLGVVTSKTGAAIKDIMNISMRRNPYIQIVLFPALVQGDRAKFSIVQGINELDKMNLDCIIVGRGGGSIEDLWAFNEPEVIEAIFAAKTPIISAVGHEVDFTIADFVSDLRAPTPSAAAELAVCDISSIIRQINDYERRLQIQMNSVVYNYRSYLEKLCIKLDYLSPVNQVMEKRQKLMNMEDNLNALIKKCLTEYVNRLKLDVTKLEALSPLSMLSKGFGYVEDSDNNQISSISQISKGDRIKTVLKDGYFEAEVTNINTQL